MPAHRSSHLLPHGGFRRPFGYDDDKITIRPDEAAVIRTVVARFLGDESLRSLAAWLDAEGIRTVSGKEWRTRTLRGIIPREQIAGLRDHRGAVVSKAVWDAIISEDEHRRVLNRMAERKASGRRTPQRYLLTGLLCGTPARCAVWRTGEGHSATLACTSGLGGPRDQPDGALMLGSGVSARRGEARGDQR